MNIPIKEVLKYYAVSVTFNENKNSKVKFLVTANSKKEAVNQTAEYFSNFPNKVEICKVALTSIRTILGNQDASWLYLIKIIFICNGLNMPKRRTIAVCADKIIDVINIVDQGMEDICNIKHVLLSHQQLKKLEYSEPLDYIDYEIDGIVRSEMELLK